MVNHLQLEAFTELQIARDNKTQCFLTSQEATALLAHIERLESNQIPEGCVAVPREPTWEMHSAGRRAYLDMMQASFAECPDRFCGREHMPIWRAMLAATHGEGE